MFNLIEHFTKMSYHNALHISTSHIITLFGYMHYHLEYHVRYVFLKTHLNLVQGKHNPDTTYFIASQIEN